MAWIALVLIAFIIFCGWIAYLHYQTFGEGDDDYEPKA